MPNCVRLVGDRGQICGMLVAGGGNIHAVGGCRTLQHGQHNNVKRHRRKYGLGEGSTVVSKDGKTQFRRGEVVARTGIPKGE